MKDLFRRVVYRIAHDRWSLLVVAILAAADGLLVPACFAQRRVEEYLRRSYPEVVWVCYELIAIIVLLPVVFAAMWIGFGMLAERAKEKSTKTSG
ncbi:MAG TPA: hypothetical protein VFN10_24020 [Thermoanaerobaculia bacterium]|nr:hypothetical protein [Thermoanaerobaculia bacterium]